MVSCFSVRRHNERLGLEKSVTLPIHSAVDIPRRASMSLIRRAVFLAARLLFAVCTHVRTYGRMTYSKRDFFVTCRVARGVGRTVLLPTFCVRAIYTQGSDLLRANFPFFPFLLCA